MPREKPIGIDLGTTNSAVAWLDESGRSAMLPNAEGDLLTPSIVLFADGEVVVGKDARSATAVNPQMVAEWVKRDMGQPAYCRPIRGKYLPPEVIQACILRKLKSDIAGTLGPEARVVITVPAYFDELRRKSTADAGEMAGLQVLDIVNEPTAAALAFGERLGYLSPGGAAGQELTVLVYDLGGGTFDATLLKLSPNNIHAVATDGDVQLGGHDWDERLIDHVAESFKAAHGADPRQDPAALSRLFTGVVEAKHTLSVRSHATIRVDHAGSNSEIRVTRQQFNELTADLLERTIYTSRQLIAAAKLDWKDISRVLLVGGSTRMPMVAEALQQMSGIVPDRTVNPDEAVARGAALYAGHLLAKQAKGASKATFAVTNVNAHSLGVQGIDQETMRKTNVILIPRNTPLPAKFTEQFVTKSEGQRSIALQILEGESSLPGECIAIGRTVIRDLPDGLPKGWPVEVTFEYGTNGRLGVRAEVPGTQKSAMLRLEHTVGLSREGISRWKQPIDSSAGFGAFGSMGQEMPEAPAASGPATAEAELASAPTGSHGQSGKTAAPPAAPQTVSAGGSAEMPAGRAAAAAAGAAPGNPRPAAGLPAARQAAPGARPKADTLQARPKSTGNQESKPRPRRRIPRWIINVVGHVLAAAIGLGLGYLLLSQIRPDAFPLPWWK